MLCPICQKTVKSRRGLQKHITQQHNLPKEESARIAMETAAEEEQKTQAPQEEETLEDVIEEQITKPSSNDRLEALIQQSAKENEDDEEPTCLEPQSVEPPSQEAVVEEPPSTNTVLQQPLVTSIPVGSKVLLNGAVWRENQGVWSYGEAYDLELMIIARKEWNGGFVLTGRPQGTKEQWLFLESWVLTGVIEPWFEWKLHGTLQVVELGQVVQTQPVEMPPVEDIPLSEEDRKYIEELEAFEKNVQRFYDANEDKKAADKHLKVIDKETRPIIMTFVKEHGRASMEGKHDKLIDLDEIRVHIVKDKDREVLKRDEDKIVSWLQANQLTMALRYSVDIDQWNDLKEKGMVPAEFIREVEELTVVPGNEKLVIKDRPKH